MCGKKIEYLASSENEAQLDITMVTSKRDIVAINIFFYDKNKDLYNNKYYTASLVIDGEKNTKATIPIKIKEKMFFNIVFYSDNMKKEVENIMFPVYAHESEICDLNIKGMCESENPVKVIYEQNKIEQIKEKIFMLNETLEFEPFNNLVPIEKIRLISSLNIKNRYATMFLLKKVDEFKIDYEDEYLFPLKIIKENDIIEFELSEKYYVDFVKGEISNKYISNGVLTNKIVLPYKQEVYEFVFKMEDTFYSFSEVSFKIKVKTTGDLVGDCDFAKYCFRRIYI